MKTLLLSILFLGASFAQSPTRSVVFTVTDPANDPATTVYDIHRRAKDPNKACTDPTFTAPWTVVGTTPLNSKTVTLPITKGRHCIAASARIVDLSSPLSPSSQLDVAPSTPTGITVTVDLALSDDGTVTVLRASASTKNE